MKMKLNLIVLPLLLMVSGCATSRFVNTEKSEAFIIDNFRRIAIFPFPGDNLNMGNAVADALSAELMAMGFDVVERSQLTTVIKEQKLNASGAISNAELRELGKTLNVNALVFGSLTPTWNGTVFVLDLRFVNAANGEVLWASNYINNSPRHRTQNLRETTNSIANSIRERLFEKDPISETKIILVQNPYVKRKKYIKIALLPLMGPSYYAAREALHGALTTELIGNGIKLVERERIGQIWDEQFGFASGIYSKALSDATFNPSEIFKSTNPIADISLSQNDLTAIGQLTGAEAVLIGSFSPLFTFGDPYFIHIANLRLIDIESGRIVWSIAYYNGDSNDRDDVAQTAGWLAATISSAIKTDNYKDYQESYKNALKRIGASQIFINDKIMSFQNEE